jgi:hypothetical protein
MKKTIASALLALLASAAARAEIGVSVSIGQPGFYGQIDIGDYPAPRLIYAEPIIIHRAPSPGRPLYLHVPPGHEKNWAKHCVHYDACGRPVYFVRDEWYNDVYVPAYQERHGGRGNGHGPSDDHGPGNGGGPGKSHGHGHD